MNDKVDRAHVVPAWFWAAAGAALLFWALGCYAYIAQVSADRATLALDQRAMWDATPTWMVAAYATAVWVGLVGAVLLLLRRKLAVPVLLVSLIGRLVDPGAVAGAAPFVPSDYSIEGLRKLFMTDGGLVTGWTHYLAFDLFVGLWIARDADAKGFSRLVQAPILLLIFLAGPIGLVLWLVIRERRARRRQP